MLLRNVMPMAERLATDHRQLGLSGERDWQMSENTFAPTGGCLREAFALRSDIVFLNHGSFGARPWPVIQEYRRWQLELEKQPVEFLGRRFAPLMREARAVLAGYVGAATDDLVFVPNATTGLNAVARSLPLAPGDEVLTCDHEYGALDSTWRFVCDRRGASYIQQPLELPVRSAADLVETVWAGVTDRTRVLFLSHITSPTALTLPVAELVRRARAAGILTVIDGAHVPGHLPLDLDELGADFYAGNLHKWLCAPAGSAFLHVRPEVQHLLRPLVISWGWNRSEEVYGPGDPPRATGRFVDEQEWQGTRDPAAYLAVPEAIRFAQAHGWPRVRARCHALLREARRLVEQLTGLPPICPDSAKWFCQMAALPLPPCDDQALKARLYDEYRVEVPVVDWQGRQFVRVSVQGYNNYRDIEILVEALSRLLPQVAKQPGA